MKQFVFTFTDFPRYIARDLRNLIQDGYRIVSMTSMPDAGTRNTMMEVVIVAEKSVEETK